MNRRFYARFIVIVWVVVLASYFYMEFKSDRKHITEIAVKQATGTLQELNEIAIWNMGYENVYVEVSKKTPPNLWIKPSATTTDGRRLSKVSFPTMLTQISSIKSHEYGVETHTSSLMPMTPENNPDPWEREALENLDKGEGFQLAFLKDANGLHIFRYMKPVYVEEACLNCHAEQGYSIGDVRAGYTATIPVEDLVENSNEHLRGLALLLAILGAMGAGMAVLIEKQYLRDQTHIAHLNEMSIADELTGLNNRRVFLTLAQQQLKYAERHKLKALLLFIDLNKFKQINDIYGHKEGDAVLIRMAGILQNSYRESDIVGRFGGDEFVVLAMGISAEHTNLMIGRLQKKVERDNEAHNVPYELSISIGIAEWDPENPKMLELLIIQADEEMYDDKQSKNRV